MKTGYDKHFKKIKKTGRPIDLAKEVKKAMSQQRQHQKNSADHFQYFLFSVF